MADNSKPVDMCSDNLNSICEPDDLGDSGGQKISVSNCLHHSGTKPESFVVDMERFSHLIEKEINSKTRVTLQRSLSRKGSIRNGERNLSGNERDTNMTANSPRASVPEKPTLVALDHPHHHHQITITSGTACSAAPETKLLAKRPSFRRSALTIDPRKLLFYFATLSCMGTILLIYFTLSIGNMNGEVDEFLN